MQLTPEEHKRIGRQGIKADIEQWHEKARAQFMRLCDARPAKVPDLAEAIRAGRIDGGVTWEEQTACGCAIGTLSFEGTNDVQLVYTRANELRLEVDQQTSSLECLLFSVHPGDTPDAHPVLALLASWIDDWTKKNPNGCAPV